MSTKYWKLIAAPTAAAVVTFLVPASVFAQRGAAPGRASVNPAGANGFNSNQTANGFNGNQATYALPPFQINSSPISPFQSSNAGLGLNSQANTNPALSGPLTPGIGTSFYGLNPGQGTFVTPGLGLAGTGFNPVNQGVATPFGYNPYSNGYNQFPFGFGISGGAYGTAPQAYNPGPMRNGIVLDTGRLPDLPPQMFLRPQGGSQDNGPATISITVPETAQLLVDGKQVKLDGTSYVATYPNLASDDVRYVTIKATWKESENEVSREQKLFLKGGSHRSVILFGQPTVAQAAPAESK